MDALHVVREPVTPGGSGVCNARRISVAVAIDARQPRTIVGNEAAAVASQREADGGHQRSRGFATPVSRLAVGLPEIVDALLQAGPAMGPVSRIFRHHCTLLWPDGTGHRLTLILPPRTYRVPGTLTTAGMNGALPRSRSAIDAGHGRSHSQAYGPRRHPCDTTAPGCPGCLPRPSPSMSPPDFHPAIARWFDAAFPGPTEAQVAAWPAIMAGRSTLVAAPTGSGKTLTAFLAAIDALVRESQEQGGLPDETRVLYVSPLKALSNDIALNLEAPLAGIGAALRELGLPEAGIRTAVRTGDTPQS